MCTLKLGWYKMQRDGLHLLLRWCLNKRSVTPSWWWCIMLRVCLLVFVWSHIQASWFRQQPLTQINTVYRELGVVRGRADSREPAYIRAAARLLVCSSTRLTFTLLYRRGNVATMVRCSYKPADQTLFNEIMYFNTWVNLYFYFCIIVPYQDTLFSFRVLLLVIISIGYNNERGRRWGIFLWNAQLFRDTLHTKIKICPTKI